MTAVRVLVDYVGQWMAGDIVTDAPEGLIHMATVGTRNAATGELIAVIIEDSSLPKVPKGEEIAILNELTERAIALEISDAETLSITGLISAITNAEFVLLEKQKTDNEAKEAAELAVLRDHAKESKIAGYTKLSAQELRLSIQEATKSSVGDQDAK